MSVLVKRSFTLAGHRTSVALEPEFWEALVAVAGEKRAGAVRAGGRDGCGAGRRTAARVRLAGIRAQNFASSLAR